MTTLCDLGRFPEARPHLEALAGMGVPVAVTTDDAHVTITIEGNVFYKGELPPEAEAESTA